MKSFISLITLMILILPCTFMMEGSESSTSIQNENVTSYYYDGDNVWITEVLHETGTVYDNNNQIEFDSVEITYMNTPYSEESSVCLEYFREGASVYSEDKILKKTDSDTLQEYSSGVWSPVYPDDNNSMNKIIPNKIASFIFRELIEFVAEYTISIAIEKLMQPSGEVLSKNFITDDFAIVESSKGGPTTFYINGQATPGFEFSNAMLNKLESNNYYFVLGYELAPDYRLICDVSLSYMQACSILELNSQSYNIWTEHKYYANDLCDYFGGYVSDKNDACGPFDHLHYKIGDGYSKARVIYGF